MDASWTKVKEEFGKRNDLSKRFAALQGQVDLIQDTPDTRMDPLVTDARTTLESAKVLLACQSWSWVH